MEKSNNSFSIFLNVILGLLFIGSVVFSYFFGNFGGINLQELNSNYTQKDSIKFSDLSNEIKKQYIKKDSITKPKIDDENLKKIFDEDGNPIDIFVTDEDEYVDILKSLQNKILFIEHENMVMSNEKDELLSLIENEKTKNLSNEKSLLSNNLEKINEAEQQHYKNISELTMKINDLQRENIRLAQQINGNDDVKSKLIEDLELKIVENQKKSKLNEQELLNDAELKYKTYEKQILTLNKNLQEVHNLRKEQKSNEVLILSKKDNKITQLQNKINELMMEKNNILTKNSQEIMNLEKKNSEKLEEFNILVQNNNLEKNDIKKEYKKTLDKIEENYKEKLSLIVQEMKTLENNLNIEKQKNKSQIQTSTNEIQNIKNKYSKLLENEQKTLAQEKEKYAAVVEKNQKLIAALNEQNQIREKDKEKMSVVLAKIKTLEKNLNIEKQKNISQIQTSLEEIKSLNNKYKNLLDNGEKQVKSEKAKYLELIALNKKLNAALNKQSKEAEKYKDEVYQLQDKVKVLEESASNVELQVNELVKINEEKHNKNYKILNEKVASFENKIANLEKKRTEQILLLENEKAEIISTLNIAYTQNIDKDKKINKLESDIQDLSSKKDKLELSENDKLLAIRKSFNDLQKKVNKREEEFALVIDNYKKDILEKDIKINESKKDKEKLAQYISEVAKLKETIKTFEGQIVGGDKTVPISDKKRKLAQLGSIECDDMNSGNFKISSTCKEKVNSFLSQYDTSNYFEVIPIVGTGGFASLNLIKRKSKLGIADTEIERLTKLANLGLGKHRAKEGGWLIKEKFGDSAKISYTVYNIEAKNKRGFVIRVYR